MKKSLTFAMLTMMSALAFAHARLQTSNPANGATVSPAPTQLRLEYGEPVEVAFCSIKLTGPGNVVVPTGKAVGDSTDDKALVLQLPKLPSGDYVVQWGAMGHDGHHTKGEIRFKVQ